MNPKAVIITVAANAAVMTRTIHTAMTAAAAARMSLGPVAVPVMTVTAKAAAAMSAMRRESAVNAAATEEQAARAGHAPVKAVTVAARATLKNSVSVSTVLRDSALISASSAMKSCRENPRNAGSAENYAAAARPT